MRHSPIALFTYNRPHHTRKTLHSLALNKYANKSDLIIYSDGSKNELQSDNVKAVRKIISNVSGFKSIKIIERTENYGLAKSVIEGVSDILRDSPDVIVMEDDLETSPHFLEYMNEALRRFKDEHKAFSIGGYQFPHTTMKIPRAYPFDTYSSYRCCSWGWATWADRWKLVDWNVKNYPDFMASHVMQDKFNKGGADLTHLLQLQMDGKIDSWAIRFCFAQFLADAYCINPVKTLVRNIGLDNSGVHCGIDPRREHLKLNSNWLPTNFSSADQLNNVILRRYKQAFEPAPISRGLIRRIRGFFRTTPA
jgi:hypothetical protein